MKYLEFKLEISQGDIYGSSGLPLSALTKSLGRVNGLRGLNIIFIGGANASQIRIGKRRYKLPPKLTQWIVQSLKKRGEIKPFNEVVALELLE
jgi:hypothetical protein